MVEFYRRLWIEGQPAHEALWGAKCALRNARDAEGRPRFGISDWAGWVLCGDTD
jgi:CHAT domain-containing protein